LSPDMGKSLLNKFSFAKSPVELIVTLYIFFQIAVVLLHGGDVRFHFLLFYLAALLFLAVLIILPSSSFGTTIYLVRKLVPISLLYFFYRVSSIQSAIFDFSYRDDFFYSLEKMLFGFSSSFALQSIMEVWLNELSYGMYLSGIFLLCLVFVKLYNKKDSKQFESLYLALTSGSAACLFLASLAPTQGPGYAFNHIYYLDFFGPFMTVAVPRILESFTSTGAEFPAIYLMLVLVAAYHIWDEGWGYVILTFIVIAAVFWGGVYLRYHYLASSLAALIVAFLVSTFASVYFAIIYRTGSLSKQPESNTEISERE